MVDTCAPQTMHHYGHRRRDPVKSACLVALGVLAVGIMAFGICLALPLKHTGGYGGIVAVGPLTTLPAPQDAPRNGHGGSFWIVNSAAGLIALRNACPRDACRLSWDNRQGLFVCPCHAARFTRSGMAADGSASPSLDRYVLQIVTPGGNIVEETDFHTGDPVAPPIHQRIPSPASAPPSRGSTTAAATIGDSPSPLIVRVDTGRMIRGAPSTASK